MKGGAENRKKTIMLGVLGSAALIGVVYTLYSQLSGGSSAPAPAPAPVVQTQAAAPVKTSAATAGTSSNGRPATGAGVPGVAATRMASTSSSLDPTLDESAMLRTESLVYSGSGRNIFSLVYVAPVEPVKGPIGPVRPKGPVAPPQPPQPPGPTPPPPINLKFFGTMTRANGQKMAFLLQGEDVYQASEGDIVARKYKIKTISANSIQVEDLTNNNTQTLPLIMN